MTTFLVYLLGSAMAQHYAEREMSKGEAVWFSIIWPWHALKMMFGDDE